MTDNYEKQQKPGLFTRARVRTTLSIKHRYINPYNLYLLYQSQIDNEAEEAKPNKDRLRETGKAKVNEDQPWETGKAKLNEDQVKFQLVLEQHLRNKKDKFHLIPEIENPYKIKRVDQNNEGEEQLIEFIWLPADLEILKVPPSDDTDCFSYLLQTKRLTVPVGLDTHIYDKIFYPTLSNSPAIQISDMLIQEQAGSNSDHKLIFHKVKHGIKPSFINNKEKKTIRRIWQKKLHTEQYIYHQRDQQLHRDRDYATATPEKPSLFKYSFDDNSNESNSNNDYNFGLVIYEYAEGISLRDIDLSKLKVGELLIIALQVLEHINWLHGIGYAHRDISLNNIIINLETRNVEAIDFDVAAKIGELACIEGHPKSPLVKAYCKFRKSITPFTIYIKSWDKEALEELGDLQNNEVCKIKNNTSIAALVNAEYNNKPQVEEIITARSDYWGCGNLLWKLFRKGEKLRESELSNKQKILDYIHGLRSSMRKRTINFNLEDVIRELRLAILKQLTKDLQDLRELINEDAKCIRDKIEEKEDDLGWHNEKGKKLALIIGKLDRRLFDIDRLCKKIDRLAKKKDMGNINEYINHYDAIYEKCFKLFNDPKYIKGLGRNRKWYRRALNGLTRPITWAIGENRVDFVTYSYGTKYTRSDTASFFGELRVGMREQYNEARAFMNQARRLATLKE